MMRIDLAAQIGIGALVRRGDQQHAIGRQQPREAVEHAFLLLHMFQRLEADDQIEAGIVERIQRSRVAAFKAQVDRDVARACVRDCCIGNIHADHVQRDLRQQRAAVAFAAGCIEDAPPLGQLMRERIAMPMFVGDFAHAFRRIAFAGEWKDWDCTLAHGFILL